MTIPHVAEAFGQTLPDRPEVVIRVADAQARLARTQAMIGWTIAAGLLAWVGVVLAGVIWRGGWRLG